MNRLAVATVLIWLVLIASCAVFRPSPETEQPEGDQLREEVPVDEETQEPPVLTIDESYEAISLSVAAGDPEAAIAAYREAELEDPDDPATQVLLANLYLIAGALDDAETLLSDILDQDAENTEALFVSSLVAAARGNTARQREFLERLLELDTDDPRALAALGELQLQERDLDAAAETFASAIASESDNLVARMGLANVLLRQEEYEAAEQELTAVIDETPAYPFSYSDRARARSMQRNLAGAAEDLTAAIELDPEYQWHYIDRGRVRMAQGRYEEALADFTAAIELDDSQFISYMLRGRANDALGRSEEALNDFETGLRLRPDYDPVYAQIATLYYEAGRPADAAVFYRGAYETEPERQSLMLTAALAYKAAGKDEDAQEFLNENIGTLSRDSLIYDVARYYLLPTNDGYVLQQIREEERSTLKGRMYFYVGAQLELIGRRDTARAALLEAEDNLPVGFLERRLASWHLDSYRSGDGTDDEAADDQASQENE